MKSAKLNTENKGAFSELLRAYEKSAITDRTGEDTAQAVTNLAKACVNSVLKKLYDVSCQPVIRELRKDVYRDTTCLDYGKMSVLGDGYDLVQTAAIAILSETERAEHDGNLSVGFMEKPYEIRRLKRQVRIAASDSVNGFETVNITPIQAVYKAIRREVASNRSVQTASFKYCYIDDVIMCDDEEVESGYIRLPKYSNLAGEVTDFNGAVQFVTADSQSVNLFEDMVATLNLSKRQVVIYNYRMQGYGYRAIATALGVSHNAVINQVKKIQEKIAKSGLFPAEMIEKYM